MEQTLMITPRDPILVRDGRPFNTEMGTSAVPCPGRTPPR